MIFRVSFLFETCCNPDTLKDQFSNEIVTMIRFEITQLTFSGGDVVPLEQDSLVLLVGPNSSGKSTALTNIEQSLNSGGGAGHLVVDSAQPALEGEIPEFREWISSNYPETTRNFQKTYVTKGQAIADSSLDNDWKDSVGSVFHFLCHRLNTDERLQIVKTKNRIDRTNDPSEYIHVLQVDTELLEKVSSEVRDSFQKDLIINHSGGRTVWFHVGDEPERDEDNDRVSGKYLDELEKLPKIEQEGDGIKSFVGCLLGVLCGAHKVLMIDEPEAFLHPPQARKLGRLLAETASDTKRQVIAATHSPDVVIGALASGKRVAVCRIERENELNRAYPLESQQLSTLWSKPLLQSTGAINGIFHKGVVVCEADSDCRFFEAILARLEGSVTFNEAPDLYFIHGGGKSAIDILVNAYRSLNIKTIAITDFDVLRVKPEFEKILESFGIEHESISADYNSSVSALNDLPPIKSVEDFTEKVATLTQTVVDNGELTAKTKGEFIELLSHSAKWSVAKRYGIEKLSGGAHAACRNILDFCAGNGLFILPGGELESFWRAGPASKSDWIIQAIDLINNDPESFEQAEELFNSICAYFGYVEQVNDSL